MKRPFIPKKRLERAADALLAEFGAARGWVPAAPVPVEAIVEKHLGLSLGFDYLASVLGRSDVLGATFVEERLIAVDHTLDPERHPAAEGRCRFTIAHEIGHWVLHAPSLRADGASHALREGKPRRTSKDPLEWQADYFAGCLLLPKVLVSAAWDEGRAEGDLARRFQVSEQALHIRLAELQLVPSPA